MAKFILNISTGKIHSGNKPCRFCNQIKECNKKFFENYAEALHFFEGKKLGEPCGLCLKEYETKNE